MFWVFPKPLCSHTYICCHTPTLLSISYSINSDKCLLTQLLQQQTRLSCSCPGGTQGVMRRKDWQLHPLPHLLWGGLGTSIPSATLQGTPGCLGVMDGLGWRLSALISPSAFQQPLLTSRTRPWAGFSIPFVGKGWQRALVAPARALRPCPHCPAPLSSPGLPSPHH